MVLEFNGREIVFRPGKGETSTFCAGIHAPITEIHQATSSERFPFSFSLLLNGSNRLMLIGSVGLFAILAAVMFLTRRIDWWRITPSGQ